MAYSTVELVAAIREFAETFGDNFTDKDFISFFASRVPKAKKEDLDRGMNAYLAEVEAEAAESDAIADDLQDCVELAKGLPDDMPFIEVCRIRAAEGDPRAIAYLRDFNSTAYNVHMALFEAAVEAHPAWSKEGRHYLHDDTIEGPSDDVSLVDWFQRTHPCEASAIERSIASHMSDRGETRDVG